MFNVALIGIGNIGLYFDDNMEDNTRALSHIKAIYLHESFYLKYVCDIEDKSFIKIKEFFPKCSLTNNYKELVDINDIDILVVATPTNSHFEILESFSFNKNIKLFLMEKPLFLNSSEYEKIHPNLKDRVVVNYLRRFDRAIRNLKEYLNSESLDVQKVVINYCKGLKNNGSHMIDLLNFLFNDLLIKSTIIISSSIGFSNEDLCYDFICEVEYRNRIFPIHFISHNHNLYNLIEVNIYTNKAFIKYLNSKTQIEYFDIENDKNFPEYKVFSNKAKIDKIDNLYCMYNVYEYLNKYLNKEVKNISSFDDELNNKKFIDLILTEVTNG